MRIVITERLADWHACIKGQPGKWGCGKTPMHAIASLVMAWKEEFGIEAIEMPGMETKPAKKAEPSRDAE